MCACVCINGTAKRARHKDFVCSVGIFLHYMAQPNLFAVRHKDLLSPPGFPGRLPRAPMISVTARMLMTGMLSLLDGPSTWVRKVFLIAIAYYAAYSV
jgi:hypothetical protein